MKALTLRKYNQPLVWNEMPIPTPRAGEIVIQVHAAGLNPLDNMIARGQFALLFPYRLPQVMGNELAGVVTAIGTGVKKFKVGDEVFTRPDIHHLGAFATYVAVSAEDVAHKPRNLTMVEAAALPLVTLTAIQAFTEKTHVKPGMKVFIQGGAGGLGSVAIQVAKHLGATVATTVSTHDVEIARTLGADIVVDYRTQKYEDYVQNFDVVLDTLGGNETFRSMKVLKAGGTLVSVIGSPDTDFADQLGKPIVKPLMWWAGRKERKAARQQGVTYKFLFMRASGQQLADITPAIESGAIRPLIAQSFPAEKLAEELPQLGKKKTGPGKTVATFV
ncbi:NADP-dependent oxidoreductase [Schaalia sp. lx-100]|uniref:NADP-dependent oxidoreductase n=1 Tax=Schaalia sp. lx-100 TaxID=2899081 RepID=UPI001E2EF5D6|nr:NADP-dependent oxidoreductase [Schaalia sp. lx-100]MCD4557739.1 NADP-dependent oxidoreductase [Schaalia sp. lx-100]